MGDTFAKTVGRMPTARASRVAVASAADTLARQGITVDAVVASVGRKARGKYKGEIDAGLWVCDVTHGGWSRPHELGHRSGNYVGATGVCRPGRFYVLTAGWCGCILAAWDASGAWLDLYGSTAGGPIAAALERACQFGLPFSGKVFPLLGTMVDYRAREKAARDAEANIDCNLSDLNDYKAALAGGGSLVWDADASEVGALVWKAGEPAIDRAEWSTFLASAAPATVKVIAEAAAKVAKARHAVVKWSGFAA